MKTKILSLFFALFYSFSLCAGTIDPNISDEKYLNYAQDFHYIGKIIGLNEDNHNYIASGVVISPHYIITAAHVVHNVKSCSIIVNNNEFPITKLIPHKEFDPEKTGYYDIALGYSDIEISLQFYPKLYTDSDEIGKVCSISGFGFTGNFITGSTRNDNLRRAGSNIVDYIDRHLLICSASKTDKKTSLEFIIASGDSGGGLFIDGKLAGINSCIMSSKGSPKSDYNTESGHTRISMNSEWILETIGK